MDVSALRLLCFIETFLIDGANATLSSIWIFDIYIHIYIYIYIYIYILNR